MHGSYGGADMPNKMSIISKDWGKVGGGHPLVCIPLPHLPCLDQHIKLPSAIPLDRM